MDKYLRENAYTIVFYVLKNIIVISNDKKFNPTHRIRIKKLWYLDITHIVSMLVCYIPGTYVLKHMLCYYWKFNYAIFIFHWF